MIKYIFFIKSNVKWNNESLHCFDKKNETMQDTAKRKKSECQQKPTDAIKITVSPDLMTLWF
jgi:hypothetical protein